MHNCGGLKLTDRSRISVSTVMSETKKRAVPTNRREYDEALKAEALRLTN